MRHLPVLVSALAVFSAAPPPVHAQEAVGDAAHTSNKAADDTEKQTGPNNASSTENQPSSQIVVTGQTQGEEEKTINRYIRAALRTEAADQYARFSAAICPSAIGFSSKVETIIEDRIRAVARAGGIKVVSEQASGAGGKAGGKECKPNLHVLLVNKGEDTIKTLRAKRRGAFGKMPAWQRDQIQRSPGPVYNWHAVFPTSTDGGDNRATLNGGGSGGVGSAAGLLGEPAYNAGMTNVKSRILSPVKQDITHGFVIIERDAAKGLSAIQIADFAAMRGLMSAKGDAEELGDIDTIMRLFDTRLDTDEKPQLLSQWDLALLTSLYKARTDVNSDRQRTQMSRTFQKVLEEGP